MTLFKQIAMLVSSVLLILMLIYVYNDFSRTSKFLQGQLQSTAQDMATTLGVAISNSDNATDKAALEVLFNAVFDSGYYTKIELVSASGSVLHAKKQDVVIDGVPDWFIHLLPLESVEGSTQIIQGWTQLGELKLQIHPGFAYSSLYLTFVNTIKWFVLIALILMILLWVVLRIILQPLARMKEQADAIHSNRFVQQSTIPRTVEFKRVVEAMNLMVSKVQTIFNDQENTLARYQELLYRDKLTGLGNRKYLLDQLQQTLSEEQRHVSHIVILKLANYEKSRQHYGYEKTDDFIRVIADSLQRTYANVSAEAISRFSDDEFAFLFSSDDTALIQFIQTVYENFQQSLDSSIDLSEIYLLAGIHQLEPGENTGDILSAVDYCLSQASTRGPFSIDQKKQENADLPQGKMQWRNWLDECIKSERLFLVGQKVIDKSEKPIHREVFVRARNINGDVVPAATFMPMASSLGMSLDIDAAVFELIKKNPSTGKDIPLAVNLSAAFFEIVGAQQEFEQLLSVCADRGQTLSIEASHHSFIKHPEVSRKVVERVKKSGHSFGVDNLDPGLSLQFLQSGEFEYVKINANTLQQLSLNNLPSGYQALKTITDTLGMKFIAVGIDSQQLYDELDGLGISIMQGHFLDTPADF